MEFFFEIIKNQNIDIPFHSIQEYLIQTYSDGKEIYNKLSERYRKEIIIYEPKEKSFEEIYENVEFS